MRQSAAMIEWDARCAPMLAVMDAFLAAISRKTPLEPLLAPGARGTINGRPVTPGAPEWPEGASFGEKLAYADADAQEVAAMGAVATSAGLFPFALRLKLDAGKVTEHEFIVSPSARGFFADVDGLAMPDVLYDAPVPPERAADRAELARIADTYITGLNESDGTLVPVGYRCDRYGNGGKITNNTKIIASPDAAFHSVGSCITGTRPARPKVVERRISVLDVHRGVACAIYVTRFSQHTDVPRPDVGDFYIFSFDKIVDRKFRMLDQVHIILPPGSSSGWD